MIAIPARMGASIDVPAEEQLARREIRLLNWTALAALVLACAWPLTLNLVDPDLWGHIRYGQDWLEAGTLPRTATHTFTAVGHPWINHENLAELAFALGDSYLGGSGLLLAKCLVGLAMLAAMVWIATRHGVHPLVAWAWMWGVATNLQPFFILRPQLLSFVLSAVMLVLLDRAFADWQASRRIRWTPLVCLPLVMAVWTNTHGGFVAGVAIVGAYLGGRIIELLANWRHIAWAKIGLLTLVGLACLAATLVNPYGIELHRWLAVSLSVPRPEITEWLPPHPADPVFWPWLGMLAVAAAGLLFTTLRRDWVQIAILLLVVWQSALHLRHVAFVALLCGFWITPHLAASLRRLLPEGESNASEPTATPWLRWAMVIALLAAIGVQGFALDKRLGILPVDRGRYPVDALQFMADHHLEGKLVVAFNWAQYALAALAPQTQVAFDGRYDTCYPSEVVDMHFDYLLGNRAGLRQRSPDSGPIDGTRALRHERPDLVLIDRLYDQPRDLMKQLSQSDNPEWALLYRDRVAELWGRRTRYDDPTSPTYLPIALRVRDPSPRAGEVPWPAFPVRHEASRLASAEASNLLTDSQPDAN